MGVNPYKGVEPGQQVSAGGISAPGRMGMELDQDLHEINKKLQSDLTTIEVARQVSNMVISVATIYGEHKYGEWKEAKEKAELKKIREEEGIDAAEKKAAELAEKNEKESNAIDAVAALGQSKIRMQQRKLELTEKGDYTRADIIEEEFYDSEIFLADAYAADTGNPSWARTRMRDFASNARTKREEEQLAAITDVLEFRESVNLLGAQQKALDFLYEAKYPDATTEFFNEQAGGWISQASEMTLGLDLTDKEVNLIESIQSGEISPADMDTKLTSFKGELNSFSKLAFTRLMPLDLEKSVENTRYMRARKSFLSAPLTHEELRTLDTQFRAARQVHEEQKHTDQEILLDNRIEIIEYDISRLGTESQVNRTKEYTRIMNNLDALVLGEDGASLAKLHPERWQKFMDIRTGMNTQYTEAKAGFDFMDKNPELFSGAPDEISKIAEEYNGDISFAAELYLDEKITLANGTVVTRYNFIHDKMMEYGITNPEDREIAITNILELLGGRPAITPAIRIPKGPFKPLAK